LLLQTLSQSHHVGGYAARIKVLGQKEHALGGTIQGDPFPNQEFLAENQANEPDLVLPLYGSCAEFSGFGNLARDLSAATDIAK
jgi:hypothetical protein